MQAGLRLCASVLLAVGDIQEASLGFPKGDRVPKNGMRCELCQRVRFCRYRAMSRKGLTPTAEWFAKSSHSCSFDWAGGCS